jgi:hypothetical protein
VSQDLLLQNVRIANGEPTDPQIRRTTGMRGRVVALDGVYQ